MMGRLPVKHLSSLGLGLALALFLLLIPAGVGAQSDAPTSTEQAPAQSSSSTEPNADGAAADAPSSGEPAAETAPASVPETSDVATVRTEEAPDQPALSVPQTLPEDAEDVADTDVVTDFAASTEFIYEGPDAVQTGVQDGAIDPERVSVLRGAVVGPEGDPLSGVKITVLDHPEYGQTLSREDGAFDLAVNGGGTVTLVYEKEGYLPAQRQVEAPWRDFATAEEVAMVPFSERVTDVDLSGSADMLVAQGETVTDADGTRRPTTLFPEGVQAEMVMPSGETRPLPELDFRAVEYTVGEDGPEQMPAPLPPASGYTHAVELSVDEAIEAGAETVKFSEPLYYYVENYLEFPVGTDVPTGYYDREEGAWKTSNDGRIVKVLAIRDGLAELDLEGNGEAADAATLQKFGVTDEERRKLATLYEAGESLWRVPVDHLTPWDCNYPWGSPQGAAPPGQPPVMPPGPFAEPECESGSIIECQNQILGEAMGIQGTPFSLRYGSDRVPGRTASNTLEISLSGRTVPTPLKRIDLEISVAGQSVKKAFPASPNQSHTFVWDGKDAYGRGLQGTREYLVSVGYVYMDPALVDASFASMSGSPMTGDMSTREFTVWQDSRGNITAPVDARKTDHLGGWSLDILHRYDPESRSSCSARARSVPARRTWTTW